MDSALDKNQPELGVFVLPVSLQMLPDGDGLLDQVVHILGQLRGHALALQDTQDLVAGDESHLEMFHIKYLETKRQFLEKKESILSATYLTVVSYYREQGLD